MFKLIKKALTPKPSKSKIQSIIKQVHNEFDVASERLLKEAEYIINGNKGEKAKRLAAVGFSSCAVVQKYNEADTATKLLNKILYYQMYYPNNKFITEKEVERICKKYGLLFGEDRWYIGDIPEKNLRDIENFKLRNEDMIKHECGMFNPGYPFSQSDTLKWGYIRYGDYPGSYPCFRVTDESVKEVFQKRAFKICAPQKDFNPKAVKITDGYKLEADPIVLQPVDEGYLIVTKWGLEAEDAELTNEKLN